MRRISCAFATGLLGLFFLLMGIGLAWFGTKGLIRMWAWEALVLAKNCRTLAPSHLQKLYKRNIFWLTHFFGFSINSREETSPQKLFNSHAFPFTTFPDHELVTKLTIKNSSEAMSRWMRPPVPISMKVYLFNVTNPLEVSEGALPIFSEVGPYVYEQHREKVNVNQLENYTLSYQVKNIITFKQSLSGGLRETDTVTILNVPLAGALLTVYETVPEFVGILDDVWKLFYPGQQNIFITTTVKEILFDGITIDCTSKITEVYVACRGMESRKSPSLRKEGKNFKFSFFHYKNGTTPDTYQINQGIFDLKKSAQYIGLNHSPSTGIWKDPYCDMINGSEGAQFPILVDKKEKLYIFEKELCRSVYAEFEEEVYKNGVTLYKFVNTRPLFASPEENPDNHCFCRSPLRLRDLVDVKREDGIEEEDATRICFDDGILPLMPCVGAPIVASFPHFYLGDQSYINYSGLNPVKELHETFVYVEPISGTAVNGFKRVQFNLELKRIFDVQITTNLIDGIFPILWVEEGMQLSHEHFKLLRYNLIEKKILENGTFLLIGFGIFLIFAACTVRILKDKARCCENTRDDFRAMHDLQIKNTDVRDGANQAVRGRLAIWQNSDTGFVPGGAIRLKKLDTNELPKTFLRDNFIQ